MLTYIYFVADATGTHYNAAVNRDAWFTATEALGHAVRAVGAASVTPMVYVKPVEAGGWQLELDGSVVVEQHDTLDAALKAAVAAVDEFAANDPNWA